MTPSPERLRGNVTRIQALNFAWMFMLIMPVVVPFLEGHGLSMGQVLQLQAIFAVSIVVLEVPSGYVSDLLGRKGCLVVAGLLHGVAFTLLASVSSFWPPSVGVSGTSKRKPPSPGSTTTQAGSPEQAASADSTSSGTRSLARSALNGSAEGWRGL